MAEAPIRIAPYDPAWPAQFESERRILADVLGPWLAGPIEHIGSTAVPGLAAKPVIDIMAGVRGLDDSRPAIAALASLDYCYFPYQPDIEHWFCKPSPELRTYHLHLIPIGSDAWRRPIAFRNYLRAHEDACREYDALKRRLAGEFQFDREAYTESKGPFIARITDLALCEGTSR